MSHRARIFHPIDSWGYCPAVSESDIIKNGSKVISNRKKATFWINYPIRVGGAFFVRTSKNGWTRQKLVSTIRSIYKKNIYAHPDKYGVWGHGIRDLVIERVRVRNTIVRGRIMVTMDIGS